MRLQGRGVRFTIAMVASLSALACGGGDGGETTGVDHVLAVTTAGTGQGAVVSSPAGIDCGATCEGAFAAGTSVTLTATPGASATFTGWSGDCSGTGTCVLVMSADRTVTATFAASSTCATPGGRLTSGELIVENNTYVNTEVSLPAHPIPDGQFSQCASLEAGSTAGTVKASWTWSWPRMSDPAEQITRATPSIIYGFKPWDPESTTPALPRLVSEIGQLRVDADVAQTVGDGQRSLFGLIAYLTSADHKTGTDPLPIQRRLYVYENAYPPYSTHLDGQVTIDGIEWDYTSTAYFMLYVRHAAQTVPVTSLHLDVAHFLADAVNRGAIDTSWYVASVETAAILVDGEGSLTLDNYKVTFEAGTLPAVHALTVTMPGPGAGKVSSSPGGIDCSDTCTFDFPAGTLVTLTATAAMDGSSTFAGWGGACTGTGECVVNTSADREVTATFDLPALIGSTCDTPAGRLYAGEYIVGNDTWANAQSEEPITGYSQCALLADGRSPGTLKASWTWSWPFVTPVITRANPSIIYGWKPWDASSTTTALPLLVGDVQALTVDADVVQTIGEGQVSSFGVMAYLTTSNVRSGGSLPIAKPLYVFPNQYGMGAAPPTVAQVVIGDVDWDVEETAEWVAYFPHAGQDVPVTSLHLDLADFLADAVGRGLIDPAWWVASVETGEFVQQGEGALVLDSYRVNVVGRPVAASVNLIAPAVASMASGYAWGHWANGDATDVTLTEVTSGEYAGMLQVTSPSYGTPSTTRDGEMGTDHAWYDQIVAGDGVSDLAAFSLSATKQYVLAITAAADVDDQVIELSVQRNSDPWTRYGLFIFRPTTTPAEYLSAPFTVEEDVPATWFLINVGGNQAGASFYLEDAKLLEITP